MDVDSCFFYFFILTESLICDIMKALEKDPQCYVINSLWQHHGNQKSDSQWAMDNIGNQNALNYDI